MPFAKETTAPVKVLRPLSTLESSKSVPSRSLLLLQPAQQDTEVNFLELMAHHDVWVHSFEQSQEFTEQHLLTLLKHVSAPLLFDVSLKIHWI